LFSGDTTLINGEYVGGNMKGERRFDIDWLRVLAILTVFFFHCSRFFNDEGWHVKNTEISFAATVFVIVVNQWIMPLFFILSAISTYYALDYRANGQYIRERFRRLVVPLIFGIFVLSPPQIYLERLTHGQFSGSFLDFLPHYFDGFYGFGGNFAWMGVHLWYLLILFVFSLLTLPLFRAMRRENLEKVISRTASILTKPGFVFLLAVPLALMEMLINLDPEGFGRRDWGGWAFFSLLLLFVLGYYVASDERFKASIERQRIISLAAGITLTITGYLICSSGSGCQDRAPLIAVLRAFNTWSWLLAILGFGSRYLSSTSSRLKYLNEAELPFYILHQPIILIIGFYVVQWDASILTKYAVIATSSFIAIMALYELLVRRIRVLRFLFGMK
jgi:glucan biosynthesis protein C